MRSMRLRLSAVCTAVLLLFLSAPALAARPTATPTPTLPPFDASVPRYDENHPEALTPEQIYAQSFILINQDDGRVLMEKNADVRMNPASTTKIMTLLLAVEYGSLNEVIRIPQVAQDIPKDSSVVPVTVGEEMTLADLLYGMMLRSGNDAANAVAFCIGGSVDNFVRMMNDRAAELGCTGTHFVNPHGYTADDHYTTARDLATITRAAMDNPTVRRIVGTGQYTMNATNLREEYTIQNSNLMVVYGSEFRYSGATGVKTGTTSAAGQCLVSAAEKNDVRLICVGLKSTTAFTNAKWQDARRLLNFGFAQYHTYTFSELYDMMGLTVPISDTAPGDPSGGIIRLNALINRSAVYEETVHVDNAEALLQSFKDNLTIEYTHDFKAPIEVGTVMGRLTFTPENGGDVVTAVLVSDRDVAAAPAAPVDLVGGLLRQVPQWVYIALAFLALFLVILIVAKIVAGIRQARRRAQARKRARARAKQRAAREKAMRRQQRA